MSVGIRIAFTIAALLLAAACVNDQPPVVASAGNAAPPVAGGEVSAAQWRTVLVAGDSSTPAFDNGVEALRVKLARRGVTDITVYSADPASVPPQRLSTSANVRAGLGARGGAACLVFMTSHGNEDGIYLRSDRRIFPPTALDRALTEGCGGAPTVVVISACHSGTFIDNGARRPNRIILTAAATSRTSFGCGADDEYTNYDYCLLQSFDGAETWGGLAAATRACVEGLERKTGVRPSLPQLFVGASVANLRLPRR